MKTYKDDNSFFMYIKIPFCYIGINEIKSWFQSVPLRRHRLIIDQELDNVHSDLKQRLEWYPGITTISVVMNPWARTYLAYTHFRKDELSLKELSKTNFNEFVLQLENLKVDDSYDKWYHPLASQISWLETESSKTDYIFKVENLENEFSVIQKYFITKDSLEWQDEYPKYQDHYDEKSIKIVEKIFAEDIERFEYKF